MSDTAAPAPAPPAESDYLRTLLQLGQILNVSLDLNQVLDIAISQVVEFVHAERGFILLVEEGTNRVWAKAARGMDLLELESALAGRDPRNRPQVSRTIVEDALRRGRAVLSTNAMEDPRYQAHTSVQISNIRSVLCVPLIAQGQTLGIVYLDHRMRTANFGDRDAEMLTAFANQAAVAIQNARLYDNLRQSIEDQLRLQREVAEKETERRTLEEASRLKSEFIGYVSHELRTPLTAIRGYIQTLEADTEGAISRQELTEFYGIIEAEADRMLNLINQLLDTSRLQAHKPLTLNGRPLNLGALLRKAGRSTRYYRAWTPEHRTVLAIPDDLPEIEADEDKVLQIVSNLLSNAIKYSPRGGEIRLEAREVDAGVEIAVSDQGLGIAPKQMSRLFGRFERLDRDDIRSISGTGLGLHLTRHLVELHGGKITATSDEGKGSRFVVFLPVAPPEPSPSVKTGPIDET